ncbi:CHAP domain-containing protein [Paraconexibacter antarcticus]|uniref:CHAP domain-containing protein n=1 Tax=Paraconexibacter antarcticus TaxID=2949664 RepID=A0ABY5DY88_9ACTN|nr:CHAP domain-containing protein [Paraconexibacter antarcticus]UTI65595.1 CHAP domain-containing protein [Paraconexibacter antarcticus]
MSLVSRWAARKKVRQGLLSKARARFAARKTKPNLRTVKVRRAQVAYAQRVIDRHTHQPALQERALDFARHTLAQHVFETGGNNRGPMVERIIRYAGGDVGEPWCVDFVIWCYGNAGSRVVHPGFPRAVSMMKTAKTRETSTPQPGDIVRYTFDHTGIFVRDNGNGTITTIEGNTGSSGAVSDGNGSDGVYEKVRAKSLVADYLRVSE